MISTLSIRSLFSALHVLIHTAIDNKGHDVKEEMKEKRPKTSSAKEESEIESEIESEGGKNCYLIYIMSVDKRNPNISTFHICSVKRKRAIKRETEKKA